jgi:hypothetical protein
MARTRKYYLKNNYLTLRSKVKVRTSFAEKKQKKKIRLKHIYLPSFEGET